MQWDSDASPLPGETALSWVCELLGFGIVLGVIFTPGPPVALLWAAAIAPLAALGLVAFSGGRFSLNTRKEEGRPTVGLLFVLPSLSWAVGFLKFQPIDWAGPMVAALIGTVIFPVVAAVAEPVFRRIGRLACLAAVGAGAGIGIAMYADGFREPGAPEIFSARVVHKTPGTSWGAVGNGASFDLGPSGAPGKHNYEKVGQDLYEGTPVGASICIEVWPGRLGWRWYELKACHAPTARALTFAPPHAPFRAS